METAPTKLPIIDSPSQHEPAEVEYLNALAGAFEALDSALDESLGHENPEDARLELVQDSLTLLAHAFRLVRRAGLSTADAVMYIAAAQLSRGEDVATE